MVKVIVIMVKGFCDILTIPSFRPQLVKSLVIVICAHVVKVYNNYASTLIIYKVHIKFFIFIYSKKIIQHKQSNKFICFDGEFQNHSLCLDSFLKKAASHLTLSFLLCISRCEMKNVQPLLLLFTVVYTPCVCLYETNFPYKGGHSIASLIFRTCVHQRKDHLGLFLNTNTRCGRSKNVYQIACSRLLSFFKIQV